MESSKSVPSSLYATTKTIIPIQNSASVQSHLSAPSSQQRIRNPNVNHAVTSKKDPSLDPPDIEANYGQNPNSVSSFLSSLPLEPHTLVRRLSLRRWIRWVLVSYCLFSVLFMSTSLLHVRPPRYSLAAWIPSVGDRTRPSPPLLLEAVPLTHVLPKLTSIYPEPKALIPHAVKADSKLDSLTACIWTSDIELDLLPGWMAKWPGLVSLVVVATAQIDSPEFIRLTQRISFFRDQFPRSGWLSLHVLHLDPRTPNNPNAFLNLARLLSPTPRVALFPGNLSVVPTKALYRSYFGDASSLAKNSSHRPMIFTSRGQTTYPFSALAPVVMNRDDPLWCTERFFPYVSRELDWAECMWQVWLENFGDIDIKQTTDWVRGVSATPDPTDMVTKLRRRLSGKYRSETCMLATRQLAALKTPERRSADAKKSRWLKRNCREWMTLA